MHAALAELLADGPPSRESFKAFARTHELPLREGTVTTFVYRGRADSVELVHWIFGLESSLPFTPTADRRLWHLTIDLPAASRIEYKLLVRRGETSRLVRDPLNGRLAHDPFGSNSVCQVEGYTTPEWTLEDPEAPAGALEEFSLTSAVLRGRRRVQVYLPARYRPSRRYPLLIVHDGRDYRRYAGLQTVLDNLIHRLEIAPLVVALTQSPHRLDEYAGRTVHAAHLADELLPRLEARYSLRGSARHRGLMGASFGGVASLHAAWQKPGTFGRLLLQSGSFAFTDIGKNRRGPAFEPVVGFINAFRADPGEPAESIFVSCGMYESLIYENRSLVPVLQRTGAAVRFVEARDGHNWENWRDRLREGLSFLFPGPLWYVYE